MEHMFVAAVPGNGGTIARWELLASPLAEGVTLAPIVLPGFDRTPLDPDPTIDTFANALREAVEKLPRPRVVFGTGIGGSVALHAAQDPGWADAFILHAPVGPNLDTRLLPRLMKPRLVRSVAKELIASPAARAIGRRRYRNVPGETIDRVLAAYGDCAAFEPMWDILNADWWNSLDPIVDPAVLVWGAGDGVLDASHAEEFRRVLPDAAVHTEPEWAHYPMLEQPEDFAETVVMLARKLLE